MKKEKILVITKTKQEFYQFLQRKVINFDIAFKLNITASHYVWCEDKTTLISLQQKGFFIQEVMLDGNWRERNDLSELEMELQMIYSPNFKLTNLNQKIQ